MQMVKHRFTVLDSWRGIAALAVVAFHFRRRVGLDGHPLFDSMFLFVDFFFVLSGFVIFSAYGNRLEEGFSFRRFLWLRLGRIYPLHIFTLSVFILANVVMVYPVKEEWFPSPRQSWDTIAANLLLVQSWSLFSFLTWNTPSWSISAEFFAYIAFALVIPVALRKFWLVCIIVA
jgi:peptidoglycan/LPS O-acetylase OafA/YrhL